MAASTHLLAAYPYKGCPLEGIVCTECNTSIRPYGERQTYPVAIGVHEQNNPKNHIVPLDLETRKIIWQGYRSFVELVIASLVSSLSMLCLESTFLQYIGKPKNYYYCSHQDCSKLILNRLRHCSNSHLDKCNEQRIGYASKYTVRPNAKILPETFSFSNLTDFADYFNPYFLEQLYLNHMLQISNYQGGCVTLAQVALPTMEEDVRDEETMTGEIISLYESNVVEHLNFRPPPNSKSSFEVWLVEQEQAHKEESTVNKEFWRSVKRRFPHDLCDKIKKKIYNSQYKLQAVVHERAMNVNLKEYRISGDFNPDFIVKREKLVKKITTSGPLPNNSNLIGPTVPYAVMKEGIIDDDMMTELRRINQGLRDHYWPKVIKNTSHDGISLYLTTAYGGRSSQGKSSSLHFNKNIVKNHKSPTVDDALFQQSIITTCSQMLVKVFGKSDFYKDMIRYYQTDPDMAHMNDHLIPGTPCTHIWWSVEGRARNVHTDPKTVGPTFLFLMEDPDGIGGEITFIQYTDKHPWTKKVEWSQALKAGQVVAGFWDREYHCNLEFDGMFRSAVVMYTHQYVVQKRYNDCVNDDILDLVSGDNQDDQEIE